MSSGSSRARSAAEAAANALAIGREAEATAAERDWELARRNLDARTAAFERQMAAVAPELLGCACVHGEVATQHDAVVAAGRSPADVTVADVARDDLRCTLERIAEPAAAARVDDVLVS